MKKMRAPIATAIAIAFGLIVLVGYFIPIPSLTLIRSMVISWAVILAAVAAIIGITNLVSVHVRKATNKTNQDRYSVVLLIGFILTLVFGLWLGPADSGYQKAVLAVQVPVEAGLMAVLALALSFASLKLMQFRKGWPGLVFLISTVLFLFLGSGVINGLQGVPFLKDVIAFVNHLPIAGARGILIGIALGSLVTGLRILIGADRPYSG